MQPRLMFVNTTTKALTKSANSVLWSTTTKHVHLTYHVKMWQLKCGTSKSDFFKSIVRIANSSNVHISTALMKILSQLRIKKKRRKKIFLELWKSFAQVGDELQLELAKITMLRLTWIMLTKKILKKIWWSTAQGARKVAEKH